MQIKNPKSAIAILIVNVAITAVLVAVIALFDLSYNVYDYEALDYLYENALEAGEGPGQSDRYVYLNISDKTYDYLNSNQLDRKFMAKINNILAELGPRAVMYDIIFAQASDPVADSMFHASIANEGAIYLPAGFRLSNNPIPFRWGKSTFYGKLADEYLAVLETKGEGEPYYAEFGLTQADSFAAEAFGSGHISATPDPDGVTRRQPLVLKIDSAYFPTVSFAMALDFFGVPFDKIEIAWGEHIRIPAEHSSRLREDMLVPIDERGKIYIPFPSRWQESPKMMETQKLVEYFADSTYHDELLEYYEGNFVLIGDVSSAIADLGSTTIEEDVPLVAMHGALINAFIEGDFYTRMSEGYAISLVALFGVLMGVVALPKKNYFLYIYGVAVPLGLIYYFNSLMLDKELAPVVTVVGSFLLLFAMLIVALQVVESKEKAFIKGAFSKYLPHSVVDQLLNNPDKLKLGGEERVVSILFSDIAGFTTISERLDPPHLVKLLNEYLTDMVNIILENGGIIDKFLGDGIMAEFGAPLPMEKDAEAAVRAGLQMQQRVAEMNEKWEKEGYPAIRARVGVNRGNVIIGNMGSDQVFDYTGIGDSINLAARLESANKQYGTYLMISEFTYDELTPGVFRTRPLDVIKVKGKSKAVKVYHVYGFADDPVEEQTARYCETYAQAFEKYMAQDFDEAQRLFEQALELNPDDRASESFLDRIETLKGQSLPDDWDGSIALTSK